METTELPKKSNGKKIILISLLAIIIFFVVYVFISGRSYSTSTRTGIVTKLSQKGYIFKTYEGELKLDHIMEAENTLTNGEIWNFSIAKNDTTVYNTLTRLQGKNVRLFYNEVLKTFFWQSETIYLVNKVEVVN